MTGKAEEKEPTNEKVGPIDHLAEALRYPNSDWKERVDKAIEVRRARQKAQKGRPTTFVSSIFRPR